MTIALAFLIGLFAGLRSLTPPAAVAWGAHLGWLKLQGVLAILGTVPVVAIFTLAAISELVVDKLPRVPNRTSAPGLVARVLTGGGMGACIAAAGGQNLFLGMALGAIGGIAGAYAGFHARKRLVETLRVPDLYVALAEDMLTIGGCVLIVSASAWAAYE
jgi:uncharacterized membrane protein